MGEPPGPEVILLVSVTFPDAATADRVVRTAVESHLAACGNLVPGIRSVYRWRGAVKTAEETLALFKTTKSMVGKLQAHVLRQHPYEVPEFVYLPITGGHATYLEWVVENSGGEG